MLRSLYPWETGPYYSEDKVWSPPRASLDVVTNRKVTAPAGYETTVTVLAEFL
jgi:hypothetical protein